MNLRSATSGKEIQARLLWANGDTVRIERKEDGRKFEVPISTFDETSADQIRQWMETTPNAVNYSLSVNSSKVLCNSSNFMNVGKEFKTSEWAYRVSVSNVSRNVLSGAQLEYRIIYDDAVDVSRGTFIPGKGADQQEGQVVDLPDLSFNDIIEFETAAVTIDSYLYSPITRGAPRESARDNLRGIWVRVVKNGEIIAEYQSSPTSLARASWDSGDKSEIRFKTNIKSQVGLGQ